MLSNNSKLYNNLYSIINILINTSSINNFISRHISYIKLCYSFLTSHQNDPGQSIIFVSSKKEPIKLSVI